jgi:hypothetical protein
MSTQQFPKTTDQQPPPLCDEQGPIPQFPPVALDPQSGQVIMPSAEEIAQRHAAALRALRALAQLPDNDSPDVFEQGMRDIDAERLPGQKLFEGVY